MNYLNYLNGVMDKWAEGAATDVIDVDRASDYAIENNLVNRVPMTLKQQVMRDMRRALRTATYVDPQGNKVRAKHALRKYVGQQLELPVEFPNVVYIDSRTAKPDYMDEAFNQTLYGVENVVKRHAIEKQSYNLNNPYGATLRPSQYDFTQAAKDATMSGEYDDTYKDDDDDDDDDDLD